MSATLAIFWRNFRGYFANPTGIVFVALFLLAGAVVQFWGNDFFPRNLANLDPFNSWMPYLLLFFIPAITMGVWAEERRQGTDELLLTLPATDAQVVIGKYLACLGIYLVALALSVSHVIMLRYLGHPDLGLMFANFVGYALLGAAFIAIGMVASSLTESITVGFILGALFCAAAIFGSNDFVHKLLGDLGGDVFSLRAVGHVLLILCSILDARRPFEDFAGGIISLRSAGYYVLVAWAMLYVNLVVLGMRHWTGRTAERAVHRSGRAVCALVIAVSFHHLATLPSWRLDLTAEGLHSLSPETQKILSALPADRPIFIQAWVSPRVPTEYVQTRETLLNLLSEFKARSGGRIRAQVYDTEALSDEARDAEQRFEIVAQKVPVKEEGKYVDKDVFLGVAFTCGAQEDKIPFLYRGLSVEYELTQRVQVVSRAKRLKLGVMRTDANLLGGFDFAKMSSAPEWSIVRDLKEQYEVVEVAPDTGYPIDLSVLLVAMPSSLTQPQLDKLTEYVTSGKPTLLLDDPFPGFNIGLAPLEQKGGQRNPFQQQQRPPEKKGRIEGLYEAIGVRWPKDEIGWSRFNPHPEFAEESPEIVFVAKGDGALEPFNGKDPITSGLQEMVLPFPGRLENAGKEGIRFTPLVAIGEPSGMLNYNEMVVRNFFGTGLQPNRRYLPTTGEKILAARVEGTLPPTGPGGKPGEVKAVVVADADFISEVFFDLRRQGREELNFDNVTFVLNAVDLLAGDETFVSLRKRRPAHRTLEAVEEKTHDLKQRETDETNRAEQEAKEQLASAQNRLNEKVKALEERKDINDQQRSMMIENLREVEERRLEVEKKNIEDRKQREIKKSTFRTGHEVDAIQMRIQWMSVAFPIVAVFLALAVLLVRALLASMSRAPVEEKK